MYSFFFLEIEDENILHDDPVKVEVDSQDENTFIQAFYDVMELSL